MAIVSRLRSVWTTDADDEASPTAREDRPSTGLYECPACDVVYIAAEKDSCSSCRTDVREVPSTLRHGDDRSG